MKALVKSKDKKIAGVCGGLAEFFGINPKIVRILFVLLFFLNPPAILLLYLLLAIIMPSEEDPVKTKKQRQAMCGYVLIAIGVIFMLKEVIKLSMLQVLGLILVVLGIFVVMRGEES